MDCWLRPSRRFPIQFVYWSRKDLSRPSSARRLASASGVAFIPRMIWAGSPGSTKSTENTVMETKNRSTIRVISFLTKYRVIIRIPGSPVHFAELPDWLTNTFFHHGVSRNCTGLQKKSSPRTVIKNFCFRVNPCPSVVIHYFFHHTAELSMAMVG